MGEEVKPVINYKKLAKALSYYESLGWKYYETSWVVSIESILETLPRDCRPMQTFFGNLVGSAEQGFIELINNGAHITKACSISPCFRDEKILDELHQIYFMKLELFNAKSSDDNLKNMIHDAQEYFENFFPTKIEKTGANSFDIIDAQHGIELGSYGKRTLSNGKAFLYGTGVALPRLDIVLNKKLAATS